MKLYINNVLHDNNTRVSESENDLDRIKKLWIQILNTKGCVNYEDQFMRLNL